MTDTTLMSTEELAAYLRVNTDTIHKWRHKGEGPPALRIGKYLRFRPSEVEEWLKTRES